MIRRNRKLYLLSLILIMVASMTVAARNIVKAQSDVIAPTRVEFVGTVEAVDATTVTVNGHVIALAGAEIQGPLTIGSIVRVEATIDAGGNFTATEVKSVEETDRGPQELELHGTVSAIDGTVYTVAGLTFDALNARIEGNPQVGDSVEVKLMLSNGLLVASKIETSDEDGNDDVLGNDNNDDVLGNENNDDFGNDDGLFGNDNNDDVLGNDNNDDFGNDDDVLGNENNDDFGNDDDLDDDLGEDAKLVGTLEQVGEGFIVVQGQQIDITGAHLETALIVGTTVKVEVRNVGGVLVASEVKNPFDDDSGHGSDDLGIIVVGNNDDLGNDNGGVPVNVFNDDNDDVSGNDVSDDGPGHDLNDDHGGDDINDDHGGTSGSDHEDDDVNDDHSGSSDNSGSSGSSGSSGGSDNSGSSGSDDGGDHDSNDDHGGDSGNSGSDDGGDHDSNDDHGGDSGSGKHGGDDGGKHGGDDHEDDDD